MNSRLREQEMEMEEGEGVGEVDEAGADAGVRERRYLDPEL